MENNSSYALIMSELFDDDIEQAAMLAGLHHLLRHERNLPTAEDSSTETTSTENDSVVDDTMESSENRNDNNNDDDDNDDGISHQPDSFARLVTDYYIDTYKPDQLMKQQMQKWNLQWKLLDNNMSAPTRQNQLIWSLPNAVSVTLLLEHSEGRKVSPLHTELCATCRLEAISWFKNAADSGARPTQWPPDSLAQKLFAAVNNNKNTSSVGDSNSEKYHTNDEEDNDIVCQVAVVGSTNSTVGTSIVPDNNSTIRFDHDRVQINADWLEGLRQVLWSTADSWLDVLQFLSTLLLSLTRTTDDNNDQTVSFSTSRLAHHAQMRLMEDALCEACVQENDKEEEEETHAQKKRRHA